MRQGASVVWHFSLPLVNSFNKTKAAVFQCRLCFLRGFPFAVKLDFSFIRTLLLNFVYLNRFMAIVLLSEVKALLIRFVDNY